MEETKKKAPVKESSASVKKYKITKSNGNVISRVNLGDLVKTYEAKGWKVEEV